MESGGSELKGDIRGAPSEGFVPGESKGGRAGEGGDKFTTGVEGEAPLLLLLRHLLLAVVRKRRRRRRLLVVLRKRWKMTRRR